MLTTVEAEIDVNGKVTFLEPLKISKKSRAIITLLDNETTTQHKASPAKIVQVDKGANARHLEWLKANRNEYAGRYVALDGDRLLAHAETMQEIHEQLKGKETENVFIVKVFAEETILSAGL
jgi:hypothetical protein